MATRSRPPSDRPPVPTPQAVLTQHRLLLLMAFLVFVIVALVVAITTGEWWTVALAAMVHAVGIVLVIGLVFRMTGASERPRPGRMERIEAAGVNEPEVDMTRRRTGDAPIPDARTLALVGAALAFGVLGFTLLVFGIAGL